MINKSRFSFTIPGLTIFFSFVIIASLYLLTYKVQKTAEKQEIRTKAAAETALYFSPDSISTGVSQTVKIEGWMNTGSNRVTAAEIHLKFDPIKLQIQTIETAGGFLPDLITPSSYDNQTGIAKMYLGSGIPPGPTPPTPPLPPGVIGTGRLFTLTFVTLADTAATTTSVVFTDETAVAAYRETGTVLFSKTPAVVQICQTLSVPNLSLQIDSGTASCTSDLRPTWSWSAITSYCSVSYLIDRDWFNNPPGQDYDLIISETFWTPTSDLSTGSYSFKVKASSAGSQSGFSSPAGVTIDNDAPSTPTHASPAEGTRVTGSTVTLQVNSVSDIGCNGQVEYQFQIDNHADFTSPTETSNWIKSLTWTSSTLSDGVYYWRIQARDGFGHPSFWSGARSFSLGLASVTFKIKFQGIYLQRPAKTVTMILKSGAVVAQTIQGINVTSDISGVYSGTATGVTLGSYTVLINGWAHLTKNLGSFVFNPGSNNFDWSATALKTGDIIDNNLIDVFDYNGLVSDFGPGMPVGSLADLEADGDVDIFDYNLLIPNFNQRGDD